MARLLTWIAHNRISAATIAVVSLLVLAAGGAGLASATDSPNFCRAACHEMKPYANAWDAGAHSGISCVECHVKPGRIARVAHKAEAMKELWIHFTGDPKFPLAEKAGVPDERCIRCHRDIRTKTPGFQHEVHAARGACSSCHANAGHEVSPATLRDAGILNEGVESAVLAGRVATVGRGSANIAGHVQAACASCHDMAKTGCDGCHDASHEKAGPARKSTDCASCHRAGAKFAFTHPERTAAGECATCHTAPASTKHAEFSGACTTCHGDTGVAKWTFAHPSNGVACSRCHTRPARHREGKCSTCHATGVSWAFEHSPSRDCSSCHARPPQHRDGACSTCHRSGRTWAFDHLGSGSTCTACHNRPAGHRSGSCTSCHRVSSAWSFRHPGNNAACTSCHKRPSGHRTGACTSCHNTGARWTFRHPSSSACASCHRSPSGHYGTSCSGCHSSGRAWRNATFSHRSIPGGQHTSRSFACSSCHPNGYASRTCAKCHDTASGPSGD